MWSAARIAALDFSVDRQSMPSLHKYAHRQFAPQSKNCHICGQKLLATVEKRSLLRDPWAGAGACRRAVWRKLASPHILGVVPV
jgi:hypothetical protein